MKAFAKARWIGYPVNKVRLVLDLVRNRDVESALSILKFTPNYAARSVEKTLKSAVANLIDKNRDANIDTNDVYISRLFADEGPTMKRIMPRAQGRATKIRKRSSHLFIEVATKN
ncbi:MAG: 50S ribosomal protein L22 [Candidatus Delongbacteria bacterium]|nr:50S ribosomal protein L22 [Candidatus Delongbacteria bacterium]MBN2836432.1 50S ribosomal protein L22 [Candidatus Delongbacteria bacterium]